MLAGVTLNGCVALVSFDETKATVGAAHSAAGRLGLLMRGR